jgi:hypothetical protein
MNRFLKIVLLVTALLGFGCSEKSGFLSKDALYESALVWTKKGDIFNSLELKASIVATYLNPLKDEFDSKESDWFLVSLYVDKDSGIKSRLDSKYISLTLNGKIAKSVKMLDYDDELIAISPFRNRWSNYFLVEFEKESGKKELLFELRPFGKVTLTFQEDR